jgi:hypothetical protein
MAKLITQVATPAGICSEAEMSGYARLLEGLLKREEMRVRTISFPE